jgi:hypothetical protein
MLHLRTVPGTKSLAELVRHLVEQLSIASSFASESKPAVWPNDTPAMQVMVIKRRLFANRLLVLLPNLLSLPGEKSRYWAPGLRWLPLGPS